MTGIRATSAMSPGKCADGTERIPLDPVMCIAIPPRIQQFSSCRGRYIQIVSVRLGAIEGTVRRRSRYGRHPPRLARRVRRPLAAPVAANVKRRLPDGARLPSASLLDERDELAWLYVRLRRDDPPDLAPWS